MISLWYIVGIAVLAWVLGESVASLGKPAIGKLLDVGALILAILGGVLPLLAKMVAELQTTFGGWLY